MFTASLIFFLPNSLTSACVSYVTVHVCACVSVGTGGGGVGGCGCKLYILHMREIMAFFSKCDLFCLTCYKFLFS